MKRPPLKEKSRWSLKTPMYLEKKDKRYKAHMAQIKKNGFSDSETWSLDSVVAEFIIPRLKRFKQIQGGYPGGLTEAEWDAILDKIIFSFQWSLECDDEKYCQLSAVESDVLWKSYEEGMQLFAKWFRHLWW